MEQPQLNQLAGRSVWEVLEGLHRAAFTGEVALQAEQELRVYTVRGAVYLVETDGQVGLHDRLVQSGALSAEQLDRGAVSLGGGPHIGRLFDRNPSIDRDRVELTLDSMNNEVLEGVANQVVRSLDLRALRHHPSGVHLWGAASPRSRVTPPSPAPVLRPEPAARLSASAAAAPTSPLSPFAPPTSTPVPFAAPTIAPIPVDHHSLPIDVAPAATVAAQPDAPIAVAVAVGISDRPTQSTPAPTWTHAAATAPTIEQVAVLDVDIPITSLSSEEIWDAVDQLTVQPKVTTPDLHIEPAKRGWLRRRP